MEKIKIRRIEELQSFPTGVYELLGEPAIVINGVPNDQSPITTSSDNAGSADAARKTGFGEWLIGREVRKLFGDAFYVGNVTGFDKDTGWYMVVYEDGDSEDMEWQELEDVLLPLDINVPLKALAMKMIKKCAEGGAKRRRTASKRARRPGAKTAIENQGKS